MKAFDYYKEDEIKEAKIAVNNKIGFFIHLSIYVVMNIYFHILNFMNGDGYWAIYPLIFWGIGLAIHAFTVFVYFNNSEWKNRQILKEIEKRRKKR